MADIETTIHSIRAILHPSIQQVRRALHLKSTQILYDAPSRRSVTRPIFVILGLAAVSLAIGICYDPQSPINQAARLVRTVPAPAIRPAPAASKQVVVTSFYADVPKRQTRPRSMAVAPVVTARPVTSVRPAPLFGEALRSALIEDARVTREVNRRELAALARDEDQ